MLRDVAAAFGLGPGLVSGSCPGSQGGEHSGLFMFLYSFGNSFEKCGILPFLSASVGFLFDSVFVFYEQK